jgi:hypothetical protein
MLLTLGGTDALYLTGQMWIGSGSVAGSAGRGLPDHVGKSSSPLRPVGDTISRSTTGHAEERTPMKARSLAMSKVVLDVLDP